MENTIPQFTLTDFQEGTILCFDKPFQWSSFDVVNKVRMALCRHFGVKKLKVGHAGTLDPLATGLLILCTGKMTKQIETIQAQKKEYTGTIQLGATTPTFDLESEVDQTFPHEHITEQDVLNILPQFSGDIEQIPPMFSAIKQDGKRAYEYARAGSEIEIAPRPVTVYGIELRLLQAAQLSFKVCCSKGTYIRSMARDIGYALDSGGYLSELRRTAIGDYRVEDALELNAFLKAYGLSEDRLSVQVRVNGAWKKK